MQPLNALQRVVPQRSGHVRSSGQRKQRLLMIALALLLVASTYTLINFATQPQARAASLAAPANTAVTTHKGDVARDGNFSHETILTTANVTTTQFGRVASYPVDGQVYAEPLYVPNVTTPAGTYNLVFVATEHDSVYAFDADHQNANPIWHTSFLGSNVTSVPTAVAYPGGFHDITPEVGITGTPVIDPATKTLYVDAMTYENGTTTLHRLHALDITTGQEKITPMVVTASVPGKGDGNVNNVITFHPVTENQRMGLLFLNNTVYVDFAAFADQYPYHGWIFAFNAQTLQQTAVFNATPNGGGAGLWDDGNGLAVDPQDGSIYVQDGNGTFDANTGGTDYGMALLKLNPTTLHVLDYFTPFNVTCLNSLDRDLGSGGAIILPTQGGAHPYEILGGGKEGRIYVLDRTNLGKFATVANPCGTIESQTNLDNIVQELPVGTVGPGIYSTPAYWQGPTTGYVYEATNGDFTKSFTVTNGLLSTAPSSQTAETFNYPGGNAVVSSNGSTAGSGIVWLISPPASCPVKDHCNPSGGGALRAYDATNLGNELYSSTQNAPRDGLASFVKFSVPTVANGEVFVGTGSSLDIFGLNPSNSTPTPTPTSSTTPTATPTSLPTPPPVAYNSVGTSADATPGAGNFDGVNSYSAEALLSVQVIPGSAIPVNNAALLWPNVAAGGANNWKVAGQTIPITPVAGAQTLSFLGSATSGPSSGTATITYTDGTTQTFTLAFSDWTLGGGTGTPLASNTVVITAPYRNTPAGKQTTKTNVFYTDVALQAGKTIKSVTLPTAVTQGTLHVFAVTTTASPALTGVAPTPPPTVAYNNKGVSDDSAPNTGNFDGANSYSAEALQTAGVTPGAPVFFNGVSFVWPNIPAGVANNWQAKGQTIAVTPVSGATTLSFLGAATGGPASGTATITYTDGTTQTFTLAFSDWTLGSGSKPPIGSNTIAITTPYRNRSTGKQVINTYVFYTEVTLTPGETMQSVTLPSALTQGTLHVFAIGTKAPPASTATYNNIGITDDALTTPGNFDGLNSYSAAGLQAAGVTPGATVIANGVSFTWPNVTAGTADNWQASGQTINVTPVSGATTLGFLGSAINGATSGTATITYTDGTTQTITLAFSDWTLGSGGDTPVAGNTIAITTPYRNTPTGQQAVTTDVFATSVTLLTGKTLQSVTLPQAASPGSLHVFAIGTK